jgi:beta-galactosidase
MQTRLACDYYAYQFPPEQWPKDFQMMKECGIDLMRFLCFDWSAIEPSDGVYTFEWAHQIMKLAQDAGVQIQLTVPSASPPPWLMLGHPEITMNGTSKPANRRAYCPASSVYRKYCKRIAAKIVEEIGDYPNVWGYQIDNELGFNYSKSAESHTRWIQFLKDRHGSDIRSLNDAWTLRFWSREYNDWSQVEWEQSGSPESIYDFKAFYSFMITEFMEDILGTLREKAPGKIVSTNYMANFDQVDYWRMSQNLDVVGYDHYAWIYTLEGGALGDDMMRSFKHKKFWRFETCCDHFQPTDWTVLQTIKGWAHGAEGDMRFHWRQFLGGIEQDLGGILDHAGRKTRSWEATRIAHEWLQKLPDLEIEDFPARIAVVDNWKCGWAFQSLQARLNNYFYVIEGVYKSLFRLGMLIDIANADDDFSRYDVVIFPSHLFADEGLAARLNAFVARGGTVIAMPLSFTHTDKVRYSTAIPPIHMTDLFGIEILEGHLDRDDLNNDTTHLGHDILAMTAIMPIEPLRYKLSSPIPALDGAIAERYFTWLKPAEGTEVLASYATSHYAGQAAITRKIHPGGGRAYFLGTFLDESIQREVFRIAAADAGVEMVPPVNPGMEIVPTKRHIIYLNFNDKPNEEPLPAGKVIVGEAKGGKLKLAPYGFAVVKR